MGTKYSTNFYDTTLTAKKARVASLIEQGTQLSNAYDIYTIQTGAAPTALGDLSDVAVKILTQTPTPITEMGTTWAYSTAADLASGQNGAVAGGSDTVYYFDLSASSADYAEYCAIVNNMVDGTTSLDTLLFPSTTYYKTGNYSKLYCVGTDAGGTGTGPFRVMFVK
ncbi:MAG: hypothetical protein U9N42_11270 [Campylobacterota bacterium]|nr:hypothetical protein [Campylobacterota bacterium]